MSTKNKSITTVMAGSLICILSFVFADNWHKNKGLINNIQYSDIDIGLCEIPMKIILAVGIIIVFVGVGMLIMRNDK